MKWTFRVAILAVLILISEAKAQSPLTIMPAKPMAGKEIVITYNPSRTQLNAATNIEAFAYLMEGALPLVKEIKLLRSGNFYMGKLRTNDSTKVVFFTFTSGNLRDNNIDEQGYYSFIYDQSGKIVDHSREEAAKVIGAYGSIWGIKRNTNVVTKLNTEELAGKDSMQHTEPFRYLTLLNGSAVDDRSKLILNFLDSLTEAKGTTEKLMAAASVFYTEQLKDKVTAARIDSIKSLKFPEGEWIKNDLFSRLQQENNPVLKDSLYRQYFTKYPVANAAELKTARLYAYSVALAYAEANVPDKAIEWSKKVRDLLQLGTIHYLIAYMQSGQTTGGTPGNTALGLSSAETALASVDSLIRSGEGKATYRTVNEYRLSLVQTRKAYLETYALLLYHSGKFANAFQIQSELVKVSEGNNIIINQNFALFTAKHLGSDSAKTLIEQFVANGKSTPVMIEQLHSIYKSVDSSEIAWNNYLSSLKQKGTDTKQTQLAARMINKAAPDFNLKDLEGNDISLQSLSGKVIIADFWATWCGPCKATFPAMKMAVEKYKDDPQVAFVFIDTWERTDPDDTKKAVNQFLEANQYPFSVLFDTESKAVEAYRIEGIPTKFVIDKAGRIRFESSGFEGTNESLITELDMMIELVKKSS